MKTSIMVLLGCMLLTGCANFASLDDSYTMSCFGEGCDKYADHYRGMIAEAKATAGQVSSGFLLRSQQESELTNRAAGRKSLFSNWFGGAKGDPK